MQGSRIHEVIRPIQIRIPLQGRGTEATQLSFLENHLGIWIDDFADRVRRANASGAYAAAATVAADFVRCDKKLIAKLIASPPSPRKGDLQ